MSAARGSTLVLVLLVCLILFALGLGLLSQRSRQYEAARGAVEATVALELARAGLEDARQKLERDLEFPPDNGTDQQHFAYSETVADPATNQPVGSYTVSIDLRVRREPFWVLRVTSIGRSGPGPEPVARRVLMGELDVARKLRSNPALANPRRYRWVQILDRGNL